MGHESVGDNFHDALGREDDQKDVFDFFLCVSSHQKINAELMIDDGPKVPLRVHGAGGRQALLRIIAPRSFSLNYSQPDDIKIERATTIVACHPMTRLPR